MALKMFKYIILILVLTSSCSLEEKKKLNILKEAEHLKIQYNWNTCCAGYVESQIELIRNDNERYLIKYSGDTNQEIIEFPKEKDLVLSEFLSSCFESNDPNRDHHNPCNGAEDRDYEISSGNIKLIFSPGAEAQDLFNELMTE
mgnify:CR=1 FL=1